EDFRPACAATPTRTARHARKPQVNTCPHGSRDTPAPPHRRPPPPRPARASVCLPRRGGGQRGGPAVVGPGVRVAGGGPRGGHRLPASCGGVRTTPGTTGRPALGGGRAARGVFRQRVTARVPPRRWRTAAAATLCRCLRCPGPAA